MQNENLINMQPARRDNMHVYAFNPSKRDNL
jgi:hypothetical protein